MTFKFCPQCGTKLQPGFRFCPSCGEKIPGPVEPVSPGPTATTSDALDKPAQLHQTSLAAGNIHCDPHKSLASFSPVVVSPRPPLGKTRNSSHCVPKQEKSPMKDHVAEPAVTPQKAQTPSAVKRKIEVKTPEVLLAKKCPTPAKGRGRPRRGKQVKEEEEVEEDVQTPSKAEPEEKEPASVCHSPPISPTRVSPFSKNTPRVRGKFKNARRVPAVKPLEEGEELTDTAERKWRLGKLLSQTTTDLIYEVFGSNSKDSKHILKLGAKDGKLFNEQNFLQRAAKPASVAKWIKSNKVDFLGIPSCEGFGLHADNYRFLIFPSMGQTLLSILEDGGTLLSERAALQLACRILDVLNYIHSNEYVHGDINTDNIYINTEGHSQVFLVGYTHAFRYCPGGQHIEYREASRTPHEGAMEYISVDSHKGAGPSQRSDLQSLGYCMLHWHTGTLPWATLTDPQQISREKQRLLEDVPALLSHCFGNKRVSSAMQQYLTVVMALGYTDTPDYTTLKAGLHDALLELGGGLEQPLSF